MKFTKLAAGLGIALSLACSATQAQIIRLQDDNIDFALNSNLTPKTSGALVQGDILVSIFEIPGYSIGGVDQLAGTTLELTGIAITQITGGDGLSLLTPYTFGAYSGGFNAISPTDVAGGGMGEGAVIAMWLNSTVDFNLLLDFALNPLTNCTSFNQCMTEASAGDLLQVDGFFGDADNFWTALATITGGDDVGTIAGTSGGIGVALVNAALTTSFNATGPIAFMNIATGLPCPAGTTAFDGCVQGPTFTGPIQGGIGLNPDLYLEGAFARSDFDGQKLLAVPEPGMLALMGIGLLGLAVTRRRR